MGAPNAPPVNFLPQEDPPTDNRLIGLEADMAEMKNSLRLLTLQTGEIHSMVKMLVNAGILRVTRPRGLWITKFVREPSGQ